MSNEYEGGEIEKNCNLKFRRTKEIFYTTYSFDNNRETLKILELLTLMENLSVGLQDVYCYEAFSWFSKSVCQLVSQLSMIQSFAVYIWIVVTI